MKRQYRVVGNGNFQRFAGYFFGNFRDKANIIIHRYAVCRRLFGDPKYVTLNDLESLNGYFAFNFVFAPVCVSSDRATFENNCVKTNKVKQILSATHIFGRVSSFWQHKVYSDVRGFYRTQACKHNGIAR